MIAYLMHLSILVCGSYLFYRSFLEKETFFQLNRWVLLGSMVLMFVLPLLQVPAEWSWRPQLEKVKILPDTPPQPQLPLPAEQVPPVSKQSAPLAEASKHLPKAQTKTNKETSTITSTVASSNPKSEKASIPPSPVIKTTKAKAAWSFSIKTLLPFIYLAGLIVFMLNFLIQFGMLLYHQIVFPSKKDGEFHIVEIPKDKAPFSFWNRIFMHPGKYDGATYEQILQHEKIHVREKHSLDILLAELLVIVLWFNPFAWLYRKVVENNLEYLTDQKMLRKGNDRQHYQMSLLKVAVPDLRLG